MGEKRDWGRAMIRLNITAEGHAEEQFVNKLLRSHLLPFGVYTEVRRLRTSKGHRGGYTNFEKARFDIQQSGTRL